MSAPAHKSADEEVDQLIEEENPEEELFHLAAEGLVELLQHRFEEYQHLSSAIDALNHADFAKQILDVEHPEKLLKLLHDHHIVDRAIQKQQKKHLDKTAITTGVGRFRSTIDIATFNRKKEAVQVAVVTETKIGRDAQRGRFDAAQAGSGVSKEQFLSNYKTWRREKKGRTLEGYIFQETVKAEEKKLSKKLGRKEKETLRQTLAHDSRQQSIKKNDTVIGRAQQAVTLSLDPTQPLPQSKEERKKQLDWVKHGNLQDTPNVLLTQYGAGTGENAEMNNLYAEMRGEQPEQTETKKPTVAKPVAPPTSDSETLSAQVSGGGIGNSEMDDLYGDMMGEPAPSVIPPFVPKQQEPPQTVSESETSSTETVHPAGSKPATLKKKRGTHLGPLPIPKKLANAIVAAAAAFGLGGSGAPTSVSPPQPVPIEQQGAAPSAPSIAAIESAIPKGATTVAEAASALPAAGRGFSFKVPERIKNAFSSIASKFSALSGKLAKLSSGLSTIGSAVFGKVGSFLSSGLSKIGTKILGATAFKTAATAAGALVKFLGGPVVSAIMFAADLLHINLFDVGKKAGIAIVVAIVLLLLFITSGSSLFSTGETFNLQANPQTATSVSWKSFEEQFLAAKPNTVTNHLDQSWEQFEEQTMILNRITKK